MSDWPEHIEACVNCTGSPVRYAFGGRGRCNRCYRLLRRKEEVNTWDRAQDPRGLGDHLDRRPLHLRPPDLKRVQVVKNISLLLTHSAATPISAASISSNKPIIRAQVSAPRSSM
jgi:hypothetical protein